MKFQEERMAQKYEATHEKHAPKHAPALYSNMKNATESQSKIRRLHQKGGILMSTFIKNH